MMGVVQIKFNGRAVFEAIEQNGVEHLRGDWYGTFGEDGKPDQACVLGIAAFNLGIAGHAQLGKNEGANLLEQLNTLEVPGTSRWYSDAALGDTLIYWNDMASRSHVEYTANNGWALSWNEVVEMARDLLTPYFDHVFTADKYVFESESQYLIDIGNTPDPDDEDYEYDSYDPYPYEDDEAESQPIW
jgi:hypothetical protein